MCIIIITIITKIVLIRFLGYLRTRRQALRSMHELSVQLNLETICTNCELCSCTCQTEHSFWWRQKFGSMAFKMNGMGMKFLFCVTVAWHMICFVPQMLKKRRGKSIRYIHQGAKPRLSNVSCFMFWGEPTLRFLPGLYILRCQPACLYAPASYLTELFCGCLISAGRGRDISLNSTRCCGSWPVGRGVSGRKRLGKYMLGLSGNTPVKRAGLFAEVPTERHVAAYGMGNQSVHIELGTSAQ